MSDTAYVLDQRRICVGEAVKGGGILKYRMKKSVQRVLFGAFSATVLVVSGANLVFARGGGGGSGGGGGGGGGGFGGSGRGGSPLELILYAILISIYIWGVSIQYQRRKKNIAGVLKEIKRAGDLDPTWDREALEKTIRQTFVRFQKDWTNGASEPMKEYCTPEYAERMRLELAVLAAERRQNRVNTPEVISLTFLDAHDEHKNDTGRFQVELVARANDQLVDLDTNTVLYEDRSRFTEYWNFIRSGDKWLLQRIGQATASSAVVEDRIEAFAQQHQFFYDPDFGWLMMPNKGVIFSRSNFKTSDINNHVIGEYRGKIIELYTFMPSGDEQRGKNYLVAQTTLPVRYNNILVRRKRRFWNFAPWGLRRITTESNEFENKFCLYAAPGDQMSSFVLLSPDFMAEVHDLPFELNIEIVGSFLYFYVDERKNVDENEMFRLLSRAFDSMKTL